MVSEYKDRSQNYRSLSVKLDKALRILAQRTDIPVKIRIKDGIRVFTWHSPFYPTFHPDTT